MTVPTRSKKRATPSKKRATPSKKRARNSRRSSLLRELDLEAAIVDAPLDPLPRLVYGDWLQAAGEIRGEWVTLSAGVEADPRNPRLRAAAVAFLDQHRKELLGEGAALLPGAWIGWRGGFVDEIRIQPFHNQRTVLRHLTALLAHPSCRFVRHIALGALPRPQEAIDAIALAAPPVLDSFAAIDAPTFRYHQLALAGITALGSLRRLSINGLPWPGPCPQLVELYLVRTGIDSPWDPRQTPKLEELALDCHRHRIRPDEVIALIDGLPALRRLRLLHLRDAANDIVTALAPHAQRLELLDCSHSELSDAGATRLLDLRQLRLLALRTSITPETTARLQERLASVAVSNPGGSTIYDLRDDDEGLSWISHRVVTEGREAFRLVPGAGRCLYSVGTHHSLAGREAEALPMLEASLTLPSAEVETWPWANAAIAHARLLHFDESELIAREAILRGPREPNFFAILLYALRCAGRIDEAVAELPRAALALENAASSRHNKGATAACLASVFATLAQAGKHTEVLAYAVEHAAALDPNMHAVIAMSHVALGDLDAARAALARSKDMSNTQPHVGQKPRRAVHEHAVAVIELAGKQPSTVRALAALSRAKEMQYYDWHWIVTDPNLRALAEHPKFIALISTPAAVARAIRS